MRAKAKQGQREGKGKLPLRLGNLIVTHVYVRMLDLVQDGKTVLESSIERMGRHMTDLINASEIFGE